VNTLEERKDKKKNPKTKANIETGVGWLRRRVDHVPPPETSFAAETRRKISESSKNPQPHPERQAVTHTRRSRERLRWHV
jgi:hypothetical protein